MLECINQNYENIMHTKISLSFAIIGMLSSLPALGALGDSTEELQARLIVLKDAIEKMREAHAEKAVELEKLDNQLIELQAIIDKNVAAETNRKAKK